MAKTNCLQDGTVCWGEKIQHKDPFRVKMSKTFLRPQAGEVWKRLWTQQIVIGHLAVMLVNQGLEPLSSVRRTLIGGPDLSGASFGTETRVLRFAGQCFLGDEHRRGKALHIYKHGCIPIWGNIGGWLCIISKNNYWNWRWGIRFYSCGRDFSVCVGQ